MLVPANWETLIVVASKPVTEARVAVIKNPRSPKRTKDTLVIIVTRKNIMANFKAGPRENILSSFNCSLVSVKLSVSLLSFLFKKYVPNKNEERRIDTR